MDLEGGFMSNKGEYVGLCHYCLMNVSLKQLKQIKRPGYLTHWICNECLEDPILKAKFLNPMVKVAKKIVPLDETKDIVRQRQDKITLEEISLLAWELQKNNPKI